MNVKQVVPEHGDETRVAPPAEDVYLEPTVALVDVLPRFERALRVMEAARSRLEAEFQTALIDSPTELDVLGAQDLGVEAACRKHVFALQGRIAGPKLTER